MDIQTPARDRLHAFYASHPDVENADGEQLLALPDALLAELDALLAAASAERDNPQNIQAGDRVSLLISECPDPVVGGVIRVYRDAIGSLVADIAIGDDVWPQNVEFLTRVGSGFEPTYRQVVISLGHEWRGAKVDGNTPRQFRDGIFAELHAAAERAGVPEDKAHDNFWDEIDGREWA